MHTPAFFFSFTWMVLTLPYNPNPHSILHPKPIPPKNLKPNTLFFFFPTAHDVGSGAGERWVVNSKKKLSDHNNDALCINCADVFPHPPSLFHYYPGLVGPTVHGQKQKAQTDWLTDPRARGWVTLSIRPHRFCHKKSRGRFRRRKCRRNIQSPTHERTKWIYICIDLGIWWYQISDALFLASQVWIFCSLGNIEIRSSHRYFPILPSLLFDVFPTPLCQIVRWHCRIVTLSVWIHNLLTPQFYFSISPNCQVHSTLWTARKRFKLPTKLKISGLSAVWTLFLICFCWAPEKIMLPLWFLFFPQVA